MTDDSRFDDIYLRLNELTQDVATLKIQAGTIGTSQVAISRTMTLATGLASDMREVKADIREINANIRNLDASIDEILRLLRERNSGNNPPMTKTDYRNLHVLAVQKASQHMTGRALRHQ